jgi:hypothetical protein
VHSVAALAVLLATIEMLAQKQEVVYLLHRENNE